MLHVVCLYFASWDCSIFCECVQCVSHVFCTEYVLYWGLVMNTCDYKIGRYLSEGEKDMILHICGSGSIFPGG